MPENTVELFNYRTSLGCHVYGHIAQDDDGRREHVTLATEPPPVLRASSVDYGGRSKEWQT